MHPPLAQVHERLVGDSLAAARSSLGEKGVPCSSLSEGWNRAITPPEFSARAGVEGVKS